MVAIQALVVLKWKNLGSSKHPIIIASHSEDGNSWFGWLYKNTLQEFLQFFAKLLTERTPVGTRCQVTKDNFVGYVHPRSNGLSVVLVTDSEYPSRVAFNLLRKTTLDFEDIYQKDQQDIDKCTTDWELNKRYQPMLQQLVQQHQDPVKADKILQVKKDLEDTKEVLNKALDSLMQRGEKLEDLVSKTDMLTTESKEFYKKSAEANSCCNIL
jgi:synaptobrevin family protein YKT6